MFDREEFERSKIETANAQGQDASLCRIAQDFVIAADRHGYGYQWTWLGMPIIQLPADIVATQEIIWQTKPDVIIETGIAWGGSVVMYASLLQLIGKGRVIAVDTVLPEKNRTQIMKYPFSNRISLIEGSSSDEAVVAQVKSLVGPNESVMLLLDSNHTHQHVLDELRLYAPLVTKGQYLIVSDTIIEDIPPQNRERPWGVGNNPKTALRAYMQETAAFEVDEHVNNKLLATYTPGGYLRRIR